jgi:hypothetical protein
LTTQRKVLYEQGKDFASTYGFTFVETSAKTNSGIDNAFLEIIKEMETKKIIKTAHSGGINVGPTKPVQSKSCC